MIAALTRNPAQTQEKNMNFVVIPWQVFLDALQKQQPTTLEAWLRRWLFTNEGVLLAHQQTETN
jgi:hypothetical protein